ncbi:transglutaminase [Mycobacterium sp. ENV421]|uniref:transglutaminase-like domain-containing protein n=1 Tax=Mycobacterium sp. ENV421 TaxID=1213407 RepID=UPI000C9D1595|nr:transglutaminase family protein [Mycobacterium sp. ENV421]PND54366.1 transglutaminase [Mycobacterium sp. ENV421]
MADNVLLVRSVARSASAADPDRHLSVFLAPTRFIDSAHPCVIAFARAAVRGSESDTARAAQLFSAVRDRIRYNPYTIRADEQSFRASEVTQATDSWCVPKAVLLTAAARAVGIPARLGFADVRNHLSTPKLREVMGTDLFVYHGYTEMYLNECWVKASPAFNSELCARFGVPPLEFDGRTDALLHAYDGRGRRHMEYVNDRGWYTDVPFDEMMTAFRETYRWDRMPTAVSDTGFQNPQ